MLIQVGESGVEMFFFGIFRHNLDDKARCTIPNSFRQHLGKVVYGTKGLDNCINIYPEDIFLKLSQEYLTLSEFDTKERKFKRTFFENSAKYEIDKSGRITLTKTHLLRAELEKNSAVVLVGNGNHIEIWNQPMFDELDEEQNSNYESNAQAIALSRQEKNNV